MSEGLPDLEIPEELNIGARLCRALPTDQRQERAAFRYRERTISFAEVERGAARWAGVLHGLDVRPEERVLLPLPDAPAFPTCFLGTIWAGAVAVPVNPYLPAEAYRFFLQDSRASAAVVPPWLVGPFLEHAEESRLREIVVFPEPSTPRGDPAAADTVPDNGPGGPTVHSGPELLDAAEPRDPSPTHRDEPAFWLYTSGSTGAPKGAVHLHHDIWVAAECWGRATLGLDGSEVHLSASKLYFAYGLGNSLHCPMWSGGTAVLVPEKPTPAGVVEAIAEYGVTHFYAVPSFYNAMLADPRLEEKIDDGALASLRACVSAGEALPAPLCRQWMERTGVPVLDGIGSTELLHIFISNRLDDVRPGSSGRPIPGYEARVVDESGADAAVGEIGDLEVMGDSACAYYWNRHEATKRAIRGEWFVTGDKYRRDEEGYFWYAGRADDMFKVHGQWVSPNRVEGELLEHDAVSEAAVVAGTDGEGLACGVAWIVVADGFEADDDLAEALKAHVDQRLSSYCVPAIVEFADELPRTPTGKIQRFELRGR